MLVVTGRYRLTTRRSPPTRRSARRSASWMQRLLIVPWNHDDRAFLQSVFPESSADTGGAPDASTPVMVGWQLIGLDSQLTGEAAGELGALQLAWLRGRARGRRRHRHSCSSSIIRRSRWGARGWTRSGSAMPRRSRRLLDAAPSRAGRLLGPRAPGGLGLARQRDRPHDTGGRPAVRPAHDGLRDRAGAARLSDHRAATRDGALVDRRVRRVTAAAVR